MSLHARHNIYLYAKFKALARMSRPKGGHRNKPKDVVDHEHLCDLLLDLHRKNVDIFGSFGEYAGLWPECAARPDLVELIPMCRAIYTCSPGLQIGYGDLKEVVTMVLHKDVSCKPKTTETVADTARFVADKFVIVQKHFRTIALNNGWKSRLHVLMKKLSQGKQCILEDFVTLLQQGNKIDPEKEPGSSSKKRSQAAANSSQGLASSSKEPAMSSKGPSPKKRKACKGQDKSPAQSPQAGHKGSSELQQEEPLASQVSQVSQDEYGLPKVSVSESGSDLDTAPLPVSKTQIRAKKQGLQVVSPLKRPAAVGKQSAVQKKPASRSDEGSEFAITLATSQSYICHKEGKRKPLWVAVSAKQSSQHADIIRRIAQRKPTSKAQALALRAEFLGH